METASERDLRRGRVKQPLVSIVLFFALGIVVQNRFEFPWNPVWIVALGASLAWMLISWETLPPPWPIALWIFTAGALLTAAQEARVRPTAPNHLHALVLRMPQSMELRGIVRSDPAFRVHEREEARFADLSAEFEMEVSAVKLQTVWEPACGAVQVRVREQIPVEANRLETRSSWEKVEYGQTIEAGGVLSQPHAARNFGAFDFAERLRRSGIHHVFQVSDFHSVRGLGPDSGWGWIFDVRRQWAERLTLGIQQDETAAGIIRGMLLGYREDIPPEVNEAFRRSGTLHVFAISGSHISVVALALLIVLRQMRIPKSWACVTALPLLIFYVTATGLRASAIRSLVMAALIIVGWSLHRPTALFNNLAAAALLLLAWNPLQLFDAGFQLSFGVVASLILLAPWFDRALSRRLEPDPYIPRHCLPSWRLKLMTPLRWGTALISACLAAWIGSLGFNLYYFNLVSWVALLANMLIIPLASVSVALGLASLLLGACWDQIAWTLNAAHAALIHLMVWLSQSLASWRWGSLCVAQPPIGWIVAGYALFAAASLLWIRQKRAGALGIGAVAALGIGLAVVGTWKADRVRLDILDVGGGQAVLITGPHFERVLVDAGSRTQGRTVVAPFLRARGVNAIDLVVLTHGDAAHYGGLWELLEGFPIRRIVTANARFRSAGYRKLLEKCRRMRIPLETWSAGDFGLLHGGRIEALWPPVDRKGLRADDSGLILWLETRHGSCLFASDAGETVEKALTDLLPGACSMWVQGMHSEEDSFTDPYLDRVKSGFVALNSAEYPLKACPSPEVLERLRRRRIQVYRTDEAGGIEVLMESEKIRTRSFCAP